MSCFLALFVVATHMLPVREITRNTVPVVDSILFDADRVEHVLAANMQALVMIVRSFIQK